MKPAPKTSTELKERLNALGLEIRDMRAEKISATDALRNARDEADRVKARKRLRKADDELGSFEVEHREIVAGIKIAEEREAAFAVDELHKREDARLEKMLAAIETLQGAADQLVEAFSDARAASASGLGDLSTRIDPTEFMAMVIGPNSLWNALLRHMAIMSDGAIHSPGIGRSEAYTLKHGPDLLARAKENVLRIRSYRAQACKKAAA